MCVYSQYIIITQYNVDDDNNINIIPVAVVI